MSKQLVLPEDYEGSVEPHLPKVQNAIAKSLTLALKGLTHNTLKLNRPSLNALAAMVVEFAADLHCEIGIWRSLERFNTEFFGTPLPFRSEQKTLFARKRFPRATPGLPLCRVFTVHSQSAPSSRPY